VRSLWGPGLGSLRLGRPDVHAVCCTVGRGRGGGYRLPVRDEAGRVRPDVESGTAGVRGVRLAAGRPPGGSVRRAGGLAAWSGAPARPRPRPAPPKRSRPGPAPPQRSRHGSGLRSARGLVRHCRGARGLVRYRRNARDLVRHRRSATEVAWHSPFHRPGAPFQAPVVLQQTFCPHDKLFAASPQGPKRGTEAGGSSGPDRARRPRPVRAGSRVHPASPPARVARPPGAPARPGRPPARHARPPASPRGGRLHQPELGPALQPLLPKRVPLGRRPCAHVDRRLGVRRQDHQRLAARQGGHLTLREGQRQRAEQAPGIHGRHNREL
jgi:hypothetical protein